MFSRVLSSRWCAGIALLLNLLGSVALFISFQASSSEFHFGALHDYYPPGASGPVTTATSQNYYALCAGADTLVQSYSKGMVWGTMPCPDFVMKNPVAIVNTEYPKLVLWGFAMIGVGFLIQFAQTISAPPPAGQESIDDIRERLRLAKKLKELES